MFVEDIGLPTSGIGVFWLQATHPPSVRHDTTTKSQAIDRLAGEPIVRVVSPPHPEDEEARIADPREAEEDLQEGCERTWGGGNVLKYQPMLQSIVKRIPP